MNILITICARGGSKSIPGKNICLINEKPLIAYSIQHAKEFSKYFPNTIIGLSTDDAEIKLTAAQWKLETTYSRPSELATDSAPKIATIKDLLLFEEKRNHLTFDYVIDLDVSSPLRTVADIIQLFEDLKNDSQANNIFSVRKAHRNPYFNMVEKNADGYYGLSKRPSNVAVFTRQSAPPVYDMDASIYAYRRTFFDKGFTTAITDKSLIYLMPHISFDLDEPVDYEFLEYLMKNNKLPFLQ